MFNKKLKGSLFSQKWFLLFALLVVLAIPVIIYAAINNTYQQYRIYSQENKPINPRLSDNVSVAIIPTCVINRSSQDYFVPNNSSNEITKFLGAVEKATVSGASYLRVNSIGWSWAGDKASSTGICQDGICVPGMGENYVSDPQECCLTSSCGNKQCGDDQCGGDCATFYKAAAGGTVKDSSGYIYYAFQSTQDGTQKCYIFTSDGAAPSIKPHYYTCSNGSFSGDGSEETCGFEHTTSTVVFHITPASCRGDSVCVTMPDKVSCDNVNTNSGGTHHCSWY